MIAYGNLDLSGVDGERSWLAGEFGKLRYGGSAPEGSGDFRVRPHATEGGLVLQPKLGWALGLTVSGIAQAGQQHAFDLSEAYATFRPLPLGGVRLQVRGGLFWPPVSLEHTTAEWAVRDTTTPSAINSWIGEEVKVAGLEASATTALGAHRVTLTAAGFTHNDTAGTLLAFRGWALHDEKATAFSDQPLPPLNAFMAGGVQAPYTRPSISLGHRVGFYTKLAWRPPLPLEVQYFHYDNRVNPQLVDADLQWGWRTRFDHLGIIADPAPRTRLIAQAITGRTEMGYYVGARRWVDTRFRSAFLLTTRRFDRLSVSARIEGFETRSRGSEVLADDGEHGWAATLAGHRALTPWAALFLEGVHIESRRDARERIGLAPFQAQTIVRLTLRARFAR